MHPIFNMMYASREVTPAIFGTFEYIYCLVGFSIFLLWAISLREQIRKESAWGGELVVSCSLFLVCILFILSWPLCLIVLSIAYFLRYLNR